jgi:hypothetical protein
MMSVRAHHVIAVVAAVPAGVGLKAFFFAAPAAEADSRLGEAVRVDISQIHQSSQNPPVQRFHDMTLVGDFSAGD